MMYYVYTLADGDEVFYVGKGKGRRINQHEGEARKGCACPKCSRIRDIWAQGRIIIKTIVFRSELESETSAYERQLIALIGRSKLTNRSGGGEGGYSVPDGFISIKDWRRKLRAEARERVKEYPPKVQAYYRARLLAEVEERIQRTIKEDEIREANR